MLAAFQEASFYRLRNLPMNQTNMVIYRNTVQRGFERRSNNSRAFCGSNLTRELFLRVSRVEANRMVSSEILSSYPTSTIYIQPGSRSAAQVVREIRRSLSGLTAIPSGVEHLLTKDVLILIHRLPGLPWETQNQNIAPRSHPAVPGSPDSRH